MTPEAKGHFNSTSAANLETSRRGTREFLQALSSAALSEGEPRFMIRTQVQLTKEQYDTLKRNISLLNVIWVDQIRFSPATQELLTTNGISQSGGLYQFSDHEKTPHTARSGL